VERHWCFMNIRIRYIYIYIYIYIFPRNSHTVDASHMWRSLKQLHYTLPCCHAPTETPLCVLAPQVCTCCIQVEPQRKCMCTWERVYIISPEWAVWLKGLFQSPIAEYIGLYVRVGNMDILLNHGWWRFISLYWYFVMEKMESSEKMRNIYGVRSG